MKALKWPIDWPPVHQDDITNLTGRKAKARGPASGAPS